MQQTYFAVPKQQLTLGESPDGGPPARRSGHGSRRSRLAGASTKGASAAEAQTFLNELFDCYGRVARRLPAFEQAQAGRFLDLIWPRSA